MHDALRQPLFSTYDYCDIVMPFFLLSPNTNLHNILKRSVWLRVEWLYCGVR